MKNILIVVDVQNGFARQEQTKAVAEKIRGLLELRVFDHVIATKFQNFDNSIYEQLFDWKRLKTDDDRALFKGLQQYVDAVFEKTVYTCVNPHFLQRLCQLNGGKYPEKVFICGIDTDCCVLKIATDLFEYNIRPIVLTNYCASNGGEDSHNAGLLCMRRLIGDGQLIYNEINTKEDLSGI